MNIFIGVVFWCIGLKLQMNTSYYVVILMGMIVQFLAGLFKSSK